MRNLLSNSTSAFKIQSRSNPSSNFIAVLFICVSSAICDSWKTGAGSFPCQKNTGENETESELKLNPKQDELGEMNK